MTWKKKPNRSRSTQAHALLYGRSSIAIHYVNGSDVGEVVFKKTFLY